jgi:uncharacterized protein
LTLSNQLRGDRDHARHSPQRGVRRIVIASLALVLAGINVAMAQVADDLYSAQTAVTGQGEANRLVGFAICLEDVLIKVSGAIRLAGDPRLADYKSHARDFVTAHSYRDQMSGTPTHDEQGTRDRPYDLTVHFDKAKIDGLLGTLGIKPWLSQRPVLSIMIAMDLGARQYIVTSDAGQSLAAREALQGAAARRGMTIVLPAETALAKPGADTAGLAKLSPSALAARAAGQSGEVTLAGRLTWNDRAFGWNTQWQMAWQGRPHRWRFRSVTFDDAFRRALGDAAQITSGNGDPVATGDQHR